MKKIIITSLALLVFATLAKAQSTNELFNFSNQDFTNISARSAAMAGAFTSLGSDISSMSINPAGLGMYSSSEVAVSGSLHIANNHTNYGGKNLTKNNRTTGSIPSIGGVFKTGDFSIGVGLNKLANFNNKVSATGNYEEFNSITRQWVDQLVGIPENDMSYNYDPALWNAIMAYNSYLIDPAYDGADYYGTWGVINSSDFVSSRIEMLTKGRIDEYNVSMGYNFDDLIYIGATFGFQDLYYQQNSTYSEYNLLDNHTSGVFDSFFLEDFLALSGFGFNMKFGVTVRPTSWLRIGVSYHTPTWMNIKEVSYSDLMPHFTVGTGKLAQSPELLQDYYARSPNRLFGGISFTAFRRLIIALDAEFVWYKDMKYNTDMNLYGWREGVLPNDIDNLPNVSANTTGGVYDINQVIKNSYASSSQSVRLGLEFYAGHGIYLRAGAAYTSSPYSNLESVYSPNDKLSAYASTTRFSGGLGWRSGFFNVDVAYTYSKFKPLPAKFYDYVTSYSYDTGSEVIPYGESIMSFENINQTQQNHNVIMTLSWRF